MLRTCLSKDEQPNLRTLHWRMADGCSSVRALLRKIILQKIINRVAWGPKNIMKNRNSRQQEGQVLYPSYAYDTSSDTVATELKIMSIIQTSHKLNVKDTWQRVSKLTHLSVYVRRKYHTKSAFSARQLSLFTINVKKVHKFFMIFFKLE
jgi:hypothetical protein